jgi:DNA-binding response OmpR family regulator
MALTHSILVIDDEPNLRFTLVRILQRAGYLVNAAANAQEARQYLQAGAYSLAFLDLQMPDIGGLTLLAELRRLYPEMPVLILTAHATLESAIEAVRQGARDYLIKPIEPQQILDRVAEIVAEQTQPKRRREIVSQLQNLLAELRETDETEPPPGSHPAPLVDPTRFLQRGPYALDLHLRQVTRDGQAITLSPTNFDYLITLLRHAPNPVTYQTLVSTSQGYSDISRAEAQELARWRIHELRKALEPDPQNPRHLITVRGVGYRLVL